jgi:hypothetical protein
LTIPKTVETYFVGNNLATEIYPILKDIDPPILLIKIIKGMTHFDYVLKRIK